MSLPIPIALRAAAPLARGGTGLWALCLPGLALSALLACSAWLLGRIEWLQARGFSTLTVAIVLGMLVGNTVYPRLAARSGAGVAFAKQSLLRLGVVLYGLRLTLQDIGHVGLAGVVIDGLVLCSTFALACWIGPRWLGLDRRIAMLIGAGSSICGAAAVMATEPVVKARAEQVTVAIATVVIFGTLAMFLYPLLFGLAQQWGAVPAGAREFGIYIGSTLHEVAQVVAAGQAIGGESASAAVIAKMVRVMMLAPFLLTLSAWLARDARRRLPNSHADQGKRSPPAIPWFAFGFLAVVLLNSLQRLPPPVVSLAIELDTVVLAMAMAALGLTTQLGAIRQAGVKPLLLAAILFMWLVVGGAWINLAVPRLLA